MPQQPYYAESPLERIVDVHWKRKEPPPPDPRPPFCGRYGWGTIVDYLDPSTIVSLPYGANQFVPMVGTFSTTEPDPNYGALSPSAFSMQSPTETITAAPYGAHAHNIWLYGSEMRFTNGQLSLIPDLNGNRNVFGWVVPMAYGTTPDAIPMVVKGYTINMEWSGQTSEDQWGIGMTHPIPNSGRLPTTSAPFMILGTTTGGAASFYYDFKYREWAQNINVPNEGNQFDPNLGGPAFLWWMGRRLNPGGSYGPWGATTQFMAANNVSLGDWYTWEFIATCQPMPG